MKNKGLLLALVLTAQLGRITFQGHEETFYNLNMTNVVIKAHENGIDGCYWIDEQGLKRFDEYIIVAADYKTHPYGSLVETSLGTGIVLDTGKFAKTEPTLIDIATSWQKGDKE